jgi:RNA polymerase sigma-70 factor (ECF subfamily)
MNDAALIARVLDGDVQAFGTLVDRYHVGCARYAQRMLGNRQDAEDAVQEAFLRAYRALGRYHERDLFRSWLFRILVNQCRTLARQRGRRQRMVVQDDGALERVAAPPEADGVAIRDQLQTLLGTLEPHLREALLLKHGEGLEYTEMAVLTGSTVSALKMRVKRACDALRPRSKESLDE